MKIIFLKGRLPAAPLLTFCLLTALISSGYLEMSESHGFSPYLKFEGQDRSTPAFVEKIKLNPSLLDSEAHTPAGGVQLPGFFSALSPPDQIPNPLRC